MLFRKSLLTVLFISALLSCTSKQEVNIDTAGKGSCTVRVDLNSYFTDYLTDLSDAGSSNEEFSVFNREMIENSFIQHSNADLTDVRINGSRLEVDFRFNNPGEILKENKLNPVIEYRRRGGVSILSFNLNTENYRALSRMTGLDDNPVLSALTPQPENPYTNDEYLDMVDFAFSDYEGGEKAALTTAKAVIEITVKTGGKIIKADNGVITGGTVVFKIPLLKFLTLSSPVVFSVEYM